MMAGCDNRLLGLSPILLLVGLHYLAVHRNSLRFSLVEFHRSNVSRKRAAYETKPPCSFAEFREYLFRTRYDYLSGDGVWKRRAEKLERFHPNLCSLSYGRSVPRDRLANCFTRLNVSYLVVLGDSNSLRLYRELRRTLSARGSLRVFNCACHDDVIKPSLPARHCSPHYLPLRRFLPPNYFRCKIGDVRTPILVQYLPVTGDSVPLQAILNRSATGCLNISTNSFVQTRATTIQASTVYRPAYIRHRHERLNRVKYELGLDNDLNSFKITNRKRCKSNKHTRLLFINVFFLFRTNSLSCNRTLQFSLCSD